MAKYVDAARRRQRLIAIRERWPLLRQKLIGQLMPAADLRDLLLAAGCPTTPEEIGFDRARF